MIGLTNFQTHRPKAKPRRFLTVDRLIIAALVGAALASIATIFWIVTYPEHWRVSCVSTIDHADHCARRRKP